jgi:hypothetical protein
MNAGRLGFNRSSTLSKMGLRLLCAFAILARVGKLYALRVADGSHTISDQPWHEAAGESAGVFSFI